MTGQDRTIALHQRLGAAGRRAVPILLRVLLPERKEVAEWARDHFAERSGRCGKPRGMDLPAADAARLDAALALLDGPLADLCASAPAEATPAAIARRLRAALPRRAAARADSNQLCELLRQPLCPFPQRTRGRQLHALPLAQGLRLGCWHVWETNSGVGVLLWHAASGRLVRIWTPSNGWWEYRSGQMRKGQVHIVWSNGTTSPKDESYTRFKTPPGPRWAFPPGHYLAEDWRLTAGKSEVLLAHEPTRRVVTLGLTQPLLCCNDAPLPDLE